ncbi:hypothetical protein OEZ86_003837 [Tetradesmus obliquus]|nr:hypothetical protein OEZ86_003837 [Tetradesmus obliquus]
MARSTPLVTLLLAWLLACCIWAAAATRMPEIALPQGPAAMHMASMRALQGATLHHPRAAGDGLAYYSKYDGWNINLYSPGVGDPNDPDVYVQAAWGGIGYTASTNAGLTDPSTDGTRRLKTESASAYASGYYLNSTGQAIGSWSCSYNGGTYPGSSRPVIDAKAGPKSISVKSSFALDCSAYAWINWDGYDYEHPPSPVPLQCGPGQLLPATVQCVASKGTPTNDYRSKCQYADSNYKGGYSYSGGGCAVDDSTSTVTIKVTCGRQYELAATSLQFYGSTSSSKQQGKTTP